MKSTNKGMKKKGRKRTKTKNPTKQMNRKIEKIKTKKI